MKKSRLGFFPLLSLLLFSFFIVSCAPLKIHMIDVGEGDSFLIQTPERENILIDTGNPVSGFKVVEYLKKHHVKKIDHLILSHPDQDHIGGVFYILDAFDVENVYDNAENLATFADKSDFYYWYTQKARNHPHYQFKRTGDIIPLKGGRFDVLWPPTPLPYDWFNPNSLVLMFEYHNFRALFTGDILDFNEQRLLQNHVPLQAHILKANHHASKDTLTNPFITKVSPKIILISANHGVRRDYPSSETLKRIRKRGVPYFTTEKDGNTVVKINTKKGNFEVETNR